MTKKTEPNLYDSILADLQRASGADYQRMSDGQFSSEPTEFLSSGVTRLDWSIQSPGQAEGGFAVGRVTELSGWEGSGKSLIGGMALAQAQKLEWPVVLVDTEKAWSRLFAEKMCGIDTNRLTLCQGKKGEGLTLELAFDEVQRQIDVIRKRDITHPITILFDGLAGAPTARELAIEMTQEDTMAHAAKIIKKAFRKQIDLYADARVALICTNQLIAKIGAPAFAEQNHTPGGSGPRFFCSTRMQFTKTKTIKTDGADEPEGNWIETVVKKNRLDPPGRRATFPVYYDGGVCDVESLVEYIAQKGGYGKASGWIVLPSGDKVRRKAYIAQARKEAALRAEIKAQARVLYLKTRGRDDDQDVVDCEPNAA
jgi:RecA/RadA recombinase